MAENALPNIPVEPASKKARKDQEKEVPKSPFKAKFDAIEKEVGKHTNCGYMVVVGLDVPEDYEDFNKEEQERYHNSLSKAQVDKFRVVLVTEERGKDMSDMDKLVLGEQHGSSFMMFNTSFSYEVLDAYQRFTGLYKRSKDPKKKLNLIFGFTNALENYDVWMHDHEVGWGSEYGGSKMISGLARTWKALLKKYSGQELGLDEEFSLPGVKAFLKNFKKTVESVEMYDEPKLKFNYA